MKLSTRGRYALRALLDSAANQGDGLVFVNRYRLEARVFAAVCGASDPSFCSCQPGEKHTGRSGGGVLLLNGS
jgi:hypothetical protein